MNNNYRSGQQRTAQAAQLLLQQRAIPDPVLGTLDMPLDTWWGIICTVRVLNRLLRPGVQYKLYLTGDDVRLFRTEKATY